MKVLSRERNAVQQSGCFLAEQLSGKLQSFYSYDSFGFFVIEVGYLLGNAPNNYEFIK